MTNELPFSEEELNQSFAVTTGPNGETLLNGEPVPPEKEKLVEEIAEANALADNYKPASTISADDELDF